MKFAAIDGNGEAISVEASLAALVAGEGWDVPLEIPLSASRAGGLRLHVWWRDDSGDHDADLIDIQRHG